MHYFLFIVKNISCVYPAYNLMQSFLLCTLGKMNNEMDKMWQQIY